MARTAIAYGGPTHNATPRQIEQAKKEGADYYKGGKRYSTAGSKTSSSKITTSNKSKTTQVVFSEKAYKLAEQRLVKEQEDQGISTAFTSEKEPERIALIVPEKQPEEATTKSIEVKFFKEEEPKKATSTQRSKQQTAIEQARTYYTSPIIPSVKAKEQGMSIAAAAKEEPASGLARIKYKYAIAEEVVSGKVQKLLPEWNKKFTESIQSGKYNFIQPEPLIGFKNGKLTINPGTSKLRQNIYNIEAGYAKGIYEGIREEPLKIATNIAAFTLLPGALSAVGKTVKTVKGISAIEAISSTKIAQYSTKILGGTIKYGIPLSYGASIVGRVAAQPGYYSKGKELGNITATEIAPMAIGTYLGVKTIPNIKSKLTVKGEEIAKGSIISSDVLSGSKTFPTAPQIKQLEIAKSGKYTKLLTEEPAGWHATPEYWSDLISKPGTRTKEVAGTFVSVKGLSPYFLRVSSGNYKYFGDEIFPILGKPEALLIKTKGFRSIPKSKLKGYGIIEEGPAWKFTLKEAEKGYAYLPRMKAEAEAVIPPETLFKDVTTKQRYLTYEGRRIRIRELESVGTSKITKAAKDNLKNISEYSYYSRKTPYGVSPISYIGGAIKLTSSSKQQKYSYNNVSKMLGYSKTSQYKKPSYEISYKYKESKIPTSYIPKSYKLESGYSKAQSSKITEKLFSYKPYGGTSYRSYSKRYEPYVSAGYGKYSPKSSYGTKSTSVKKMLGGKQRYGKPIKIKKYKKLKKITKYNPSLVAIETKKLSKMPDILTGLEVRPIIS